MACMFKKILTSDRRIGVMISTCPLCTDRRCLLVKSQDNLVYNVENLAANHYPLIKRNLEEPLSLT